MYMGYSYILMPRKRIKTMSEYEYLAGQAFGYFSISLAQQARKYQNKSRTHVIWSRQMIVAEL